MFINKKKLKQALVFSLWYTVHDPVKFIVSSSWFCVFEMKVDLSFGHTFDGVNLKLTLHLVTLWHFDIIQCHSVCDTVTSFNIFNMKYAQIRRLFTVFGPLLTESLLHKHGTFDSCNQYVNCISKKMYCMLFLCIQQINDCEPPISGHCSFTSGTLQ